MHSHADTAQTALALLSQQGAVPLDQLARLLGTDLPDCVDIVQALDSAGLIEHRRFLVRDHPWFWPSRRGARQTDTGFRYAVPDVAILEHRRAVNEIRIYLTARAPQGVWVCEREVFRRRDPSEHLPDALFEIDGERHAIEAELSRKQLHHLHRVIAGHSDRYDAVLYFCGRRTHRFLRGVQAEARWPKLIVRPLPQAPRC